ncbi:RNA-dependent RNA polymerase 1-like [Capsella rubella]|uniref:RNA-dependent RNA polymerase 1-like n=1 Tax=Capsella rubella TaxID=81985 RepID=UPI000CD51708|nr:RNA-dependent RNA polymerase 1-like [Capsella rubella]
MVSWYESGKEIDQGWSPGVGGFVDEKRLERCYSSNYQNLDGDFSSIRNVAKYAARLGQSFSSSIETRTIMSDELELIPDIENNSSGIPYVYYDGVGKISTEFAKLVAEKCGLDVCPSAFQIRYAGYKGVVAVDITSSKKLSLRNSMKKFESEYITVDVLSWTKYGPCFLNRQFVKDI